ncbi:Protein kinase C epsilon type [Frankliniella fusca]|uniref:Protein kinase C epsilon type n=1 Tax=Frankliniella fusca TaxID=407009 RepID=A0AAE1LYZ8_9NEOP|nr:Protein kinase C epsilon type [Frankliniella fusca]
MNLRCCTTFSVHALTMIHILSPFYPCKQGRKKSRHFFRFGIRSDNRAASQRIAGYSNGSLGTEKTRSYRKITMTPRLPGRTK